jgi:hypothetical protein
MLARRAAAFALVVSAGCELVYELPDPAGHLSEADAAAPDSSPAAIMDATTEGGGGDALASPEAATADADPGDRDADGPERGDGSMADDGTTSNDSSGSTPDAAGDGGDAASRDASSPSTVAPDHLRLWLNASVGVACEDASDASGTSRVTRWIDQSGRGDDATLARGQLGPQCHVAPMAHAVHGVDLPYFSAPQTGNVVDETLDVDLSFLAGSDYSIFVVERRWADYPDGAVLRGEFFLGTTVRPEEEGYAAACPTPTSMIGVVNEALQLGYTYYQGSPTIVFDQACNGLARPVASVPDPPPSMLREETFVLDSTRGRALWIQGFPVAAAPNTVPLAYAGGGAIGRALIATIAIGAEPRYRGDIAEVVVYDAALESAERGAVEAYLMAHWGI